MLTRQTLRLKSSGQFRALTSPNDGEVLAEVEQGDEQIAVASVGTLVDAQRGAFGKMPGHQRAEILSRVADKIRANADKLAMMIAAEGGKPLKDAKVEVARAANTTQLCAEAATRISGEGIAMDGTPAGVGRTAFMTREPIGPVMAISAFNHPLNLIAHQVGPALAAGCPVLVKPASTTPLSAIEYVDMCIESGLPENAAIALPMPGRVAEKAAIDQRIRFITFIGSGAVGWALRRKIADGTRIAMEHGGTAPVIVEPDADLDDAIPRLVKGGYYHAGQVCVSVQRIYAHSSIAREVADRIASAAQALAVGDARDDRTDVGPLITKGDLERVSEWVDAGKAEGAELLCGGASTGHQHYQPTVAYRPAESSRIVREEIFGPVVDVMPYDTFDEAIARANDTEHAFQAAIFTSSVKTALEGARRLDATAVMVNDHTAFRVDWMPFGGRKQSGLGLGGVGYSVHEMTETKLVVMR